jgi:UDP-N-acetyl-2-amino-2-deoxyglucuronate dehydrogenase
MKTFALIGAAGYIAPRHMRAIKETGNDLVAITDPSDSVGIIDSYFPRAKYFKEFERFDRHLDKLNRSGKGVDFVVVCSPNYLHDAHCRYGMRIGADVICEKPLVLNPWNIEGLQQIELQTGKKVFNILQLRLHPYFVELKRKIKNGDPQKCYDIDLRYITVRGSWYLDSWKGESSKSGGITTNIGIHLFDVLIWIFGDVIETKIYDNSLMKSSGYIILKQARVNWFLSIDRKDLPETSNFKDQRSHRSIKINEVSLNFDNGFEDLHTMSYSQILSGKGFGIDEVGQVIDLVSRIRLTD